MSHAPGILSKVDIAHLPGTTQSFTEGFLASWSMILVSEIGDKTFFIACLMAMRHPRLIVFIGAIGALTVMTILSSLLGVIFPSVLSLNVTRGLAVVLFTGFGSKILYEAYTSHGEDAGGEDERAEAAAAIGKKEDEELGSPSSRNMMTSAAGGAPAGLSPGAARWRSFLSPVLVQAFTLTFLAEWGDRSQIATIVLAAAKNPYGVTVGGIVGHAICTGGAVLSGNLIASRISHTAVNYVGGTLFIFFGLMTLYQIVVEEGHDHLTSLSPLATPKPTL